MNSARRGFTFGDYGQEAQRSTVTEWQQSAAAKRPCNASGFPLHAPGIWSERLQRGKLVFNAGKCICAEQAAVWEHMILPRTTPLPNSLKRGDSFDTAETSGQLQVLTSVIGLAISSKGLDSLSTTLRLTQLAIR